MRLRVRVKRFAELIMPDDPFHNARCGAARVPAKECAMTTRARILVVAAWLMAVLASNLAAGPVAAQDVWPSRPIKLIVPFAPGGNTDVVARVTGNFMQNALKGASVVIENRAGAGGITGTAAVAKAIGDGYTLCICSIGPISISPSSEKLPYDPLKDLVPISMINTNPLVLIVSPKVAVRTPAELIAASRGRPGGLTYGSSGVGGLMYFSAEIFKAKAGAQLTHVPYRGGALATAAVVTGEVDLAFSNMSDAVGQLAAGTVRPIGVTTAKRSPYLPEVPTLMEQGIAGFSTESWNALLAPPGTPDAIVRRLAAIMADMARDPEVGKSMADFGATAVANTPEEFGAQLRAEIDQWAAYLKEMGYTAP
jgi:tripartite-type tricarboxylate transporter receptor subunit TctC